MLSTVASSLTSPGQKGGGVWPDGTRCSHRVKIYVRHLTSGYSPHGKEGGREGEGGREREGGRGSVLEGSG